MSAAVDPTCVKVLADPIFHFTNTAPLQIITHLCDTCGELDEDKLNKIDAALNKERNPDAPIKDCWQHIIKAHHIAQDGQDPVSDCTSIFTAFQTFKKTGVFYQANHEWNQKTAAKRTWDNLVTHCTAANKQLERLLTTGQGGCHGGDAALAAIHAAIEQVTAGTRESQAATAAALAAAAHQPLRDTTNIGTAATTGSLPSTLKCCWTNSLFISNTNNNNSHDSCDCPRPPMGHQKAAAVFNMMGGRNTIKHVKDQNVPIFHQIVFKKANQQS